MCGVVVGVFDRAVVEVPLWMAEWARNAARKLARKDRFVGIFFLLWSSGCVLSKSTWRQTPALSPARERLVERVCVTNSS